MLFHKKLILFFSLIVGLSFLVSHDCAADIVEWNNITKPLNLGRYQVTTVRPMTINVHIPAEILKKYKKLPLIILGNIDNISVEQLYLRINNNNWAIYKFRNRRPYKFKIKTKHFKPGPNKLHFLSHTTFPVFLNNLSLQFNIVGTETNGNKINQIQAMPKTSKPSQPKPKASIPPQSKPKTSKSSNGTIAEKDKFKIAVMEFKSFNPGAKNTTLGAVIAEMFTTEVVNSNSFKIVEREQLNKVLGELQIGQSGVIDTTDAQKLGKILGAGAIITGSVTKMGNRLGIDARIIEVETGIIISAESRISKENLTDIRRNIADMTTALAQKFYKQK